MHWIAPTEIVSPGRNEIEQMKKLGLDIEPHRKRRTRRSGVRISSGAPFQGGGISEIRRPSKPAFFISWLPSAGAAGCVGVCPASPSGLRGCLSQSHELGLPAGMV